MVQILWAAPPQLKFLWSRGPKILKSIFFVVKLQLELQLGVAFNTCWGMGWCKSVGRVCVCVMTRRLWAGDAACALTWRRNICPPAASAANICPPAASCGRVLLRNEAAVTHGGRASLNLKRTAARDRNEWLSRAGRRRGVRRRSGNFLEGFS